VTGAVDRLGVAAGIYGITFLTFTIKSVRISKVLCTELSD